ncbi:hypothetical protein I302_100059 [Kwoniella bestiolae CBS 10118]|uniref:Uncharacterized protein n=1 Tax=Kwoniella bestiolae CBS 10118 TaxID=1296100 RepID=A0A1B9G442_9TREE|nr:hypothetical protein I302_03431 [Kwoniella bestiolae CBS 10118]OCF25758.1 hypothetical protein I302_03431 [Kwoniella bestiolae CBS 10118]
MGDMLKFLELALSVKPSKSLCLNLPPTFMKRNAIARMNIVGFLFTLTDDHPLKETNVHLCNPDVIDFLNIVKAKTIKVPYIPVDASMPERDRPRRRAGQAQDMKGCLKMYFLKSSDRYKKIDPTIEKIHFINVCPNEEMVPSAHDKDALGEASSEAIKHFPDLFGSALGDDREAFSAIQRCWS